MSDPRWPAGYRRSPVCHPAVRTHSRRRFSGTPCIDGTHSFFDGKFRRSPWPGMDILHRPRPADVSRQPAASNATPIESVANLSAVCREATSRAFASAPAPQKRRRRWRSHHGVVFDDYGHRPAEIAMASRVLREARGEPHHRRHQPHR